MHPRYTRRPDQLEGYRSCVPKSAPGDESHRELRVLDRSYSSAPLSLGSGLIFLKITSNDLQWSKIGARPPPRDTTVLEVGLDADLARLVLTVLLNHQPCRGLVLTHLHQRIDARVAKPCMSKLGRDGQGCKKGRSAHGVLGRVDHTVFSPTQLVRWFWCWGRRRPL